MITMHELIYGAFVGLTFIAVGFIFVAGIVAWLNR